MQLNATEVGLEIIFIYHIFCCNTFVFTCPIIRDYYMTFYISALVLARDSHIKPDSESGGLMWVEGW
jgi:hypothetical protein